GGLGGRSLLLRLATAPLATAATTGRAVGTAARRAVARAGCGVLGADLGDVLDVALVDPDLHTDAAEGRLGLEEAVVHVRAERVQGHTALAVELRAGHLGAAETATALDLDALGAGLHGGLHALAHGPTEGDAGGELLGDGLGHQLSVHLGVLDLEDVQLDLLAGQLLQLAADLVGLGAAAGEDDARASGVDVHTDAVAGALDLNLRDAGALHAGRQHPPDGDVFLDVVLVQL